LANVSVNWIESVTHTVSRFRVLGTMACLAAGPISAQQRPDAAPVIALAGAKIYRSPEATPIDSGVLLIARGVISAVGNARAVAIPPGAKLVDCSGTVIVAGFWNSHVHFTEPQWAGADTLPAAVLSRRLQAMLTRYGFVHVLDTGSILENTLAPRRRGGSAGVSAPPGVWKREWTRTW
jgi:imidazolonepropionase-like amidohydrolase